MFHFPEPGVRYTRATLTLRRPTACQRSSGVTEALIAPPPRRAAPAAGLRGGASDRHTPSASASPLARQRGFRQHAPDGPLDHALGVLFEHRLQGREALVPHVPRMPEIALLLELAT